MRQRSEKLFFKNSRGQRLAGGLHSPANALTKPCAGIVILHGFGSSKDGKAKKLARFFASRGYAALRFDFTGCGESGGALAGGIAKQEISDARRAIGFLRRRGFKRIGVIGSSLGGFVAVSVAAIDKRVRATVALCLPARFEGCDGVAKARRANKILFIHGTADEVVPVQESQALYAAARQPKKLVLVRGADHRFSQANHLRRVEREALAWFNKYLCDYEGELNARTLKNIKQGEEDYATGRVYSTGQVLKKLGIKRG
ncbi:MAG: alpha/beta fold hydrolase [Candidatus Micrarchaeota archaeon]